MITPPVPVNVAGNSPDVAVYAAGLLYCSVAVCAVGYGSGCTTTVAVPSMESKLFTVGAWRMVFAPEPESIRLSYVVTLHGLERLRCN